MGINSKDRRRDPMEELEKWLAKPVEAVIAGVIGGAIMGVASDVAVQATCSLVGFNSPHSSLPPQMLSASGVYRPLLQSFASGGTMEQARNFAVIVGADSGISCVIKKLRRGKDDIHTSMAAGFGSGVIFSIVCGMRGPEVMSVGVVFALIKGGIFKLVEDTKTPNDNVDRKQKMKGGSMRKWF